MDHHFVVASYPCDEVMKLRGLLRSDDIGILNLSSSPSPLRAEPVCGLCERHARHGVVGLGARLHDRFPSRAGRCWLRETLPLPMSPQAAAAASFAPSSRRRPTSPRSRYHLLRHTQSPTPSRPVPAAAPRRPGRRCRPA
jgi:hypothetical protein